MKALRTLRPWPGAGCENPSWSLLMEAHQAVPRYLLHGAALPDFGSMESTLLIEAMPRTFNAEGWYRDFVTQLEAIEKRHRVPFKERDDLESKAAMAMNDARFEGYLFGLAVGLKLAGGAS